MWVERVAQRYGVKPGLAEISSLGRKVARWCLASGERAAYCIDLSFVSNAYSLAMLRYTSCLVRLSSKHTPAVPI